MARILMAPGLMTADYSACHYRAADTSAAGNVLFLMEAYRHRIFHPVASLRELVTLPCWIYQWNMRLSAGVQQPPGPGRCRARGGAWRIQGDAISSLHVNAAGCP